MAKRTICIQSPCKISAKHNTLQIEDEHRVVNVPLEDIWVLIIETHSAVITTAALSTLTDAGIGIMTCGKDHMPNGLHLPIGAHFRHAAIVENQLAMPKPLKKQLWQCIVEAKIINQATCLDILSIDGADTLRKYAADVHSGDSTGREAVAASLYFKKYLPKGTRHDSPCTAALNYGYAVLRAGIGRTAVSGGWLVSRGIHHNNDLNAFNLVDDLIEPFRPVIDLMVADMEPHYELTSQSKSYLAKVFQYAVVVNEDEYSVQTAIVHELETLKNAVLKNNAELLELPTIIPLRTVNQE